MLNRQREVCSLKEEKLHLSGAHNAQHIASAQGVLVMSSFCQRFLLASHQSSSLSLPGGPAVLRGSCVSAIQDPRDGPSASPILRGVTVPGPSPGAGRGGAASQSPFSLWWPLWPGRTTRLTSGQPACVPLAGLLFLRGLGDACNWVNPLG